MGDGRAAHVNLNKKLEESGERERLKQFITERLVKCGWRDDLKQYCIEYIKNKGLEKVTVDEIVAEIAPRGRATVPDSLKTELLNKIRTFAEENKLDQSENPEY